ncbi:DUF3291 domain-containing protein [Leptolyngbya sp. FACHB-36]|uniref:DUF3291 domain-containing protein n=1 Tax=Leptolyngbya sp. FACHB-36 TaxID=2692808 RepID=UPI001680136A|nr:DUF3291 domain-containing protein [Leptolyngbya sp. FACHB-36]MBD2018904.1 DUF3291 domain-containing protein [Leptolyngbya sp. FACHB-36]
MAFVSVTRLRLRSSRFLLPFLWEAILSLRQAKRASGNRFASTRRQPNHVYWTLTVWQDESAMRAYIRSGSHGRVMPKLIHWCDEASTVHWLQGGAEVPTWQEAERRMVESGRMYNLRYPSTAHAAGVIQA